MFDRSALEAELDAIGWKVSGVEASTFKTLHETEEGDVCVYLRLAENWLIASVVPFLATGGDNPFELSRWLLRMNRDMVQAKFAYDEDGDVVLSIEWPTEALDSSEVRRGLSSLIHYCVHYRKMLRQASR